MTKEKPPLEGLVLLDIGSFFYPCPKERKADAVPGPFAVGTVVEMLEGPAKGKIGAVVVDKNSNYQDSEPYVGDDSIGVAVLGNADINEILAASLEKGGVKSSDLKELRWFDGAYQLSPIKNPEGEYLH